MSNAAKTTRKRPQGASYPSETDAARLARGSVRRACSLPVAPDAAIDKIAALSGESRSAVIVRAIENLSTPLK